MKIDMKFKLCLSYALVFFIFLSISLVTAQNNISDKITNLDSLKFTDKSNDVLNRTIEIPENFKLPAKLILGIDEPMQLSKFVVYLMIWIVVFLIIFQVVKIMPFFKEGFVKLIASLAIMILASSLGSIKTVADLYFDLSFAKLIDKFSAGAFIFTVVVILVFYFVISKILAKIGTNIEIGNVESSATEAGTGFKILRIFSKTFGRKK